MTFAGASWARLWRCAALVLAALLALPSPLRAADVPVVFQSTDTPPFWSPSLPEHGLGGAMLRLLSAAAGVDYAVNYLPVKRFRHSLATYVVGDPDILVNQKRRAVFPIAVFQTAFFYYKPHHEAIDFRNLQDLQGHTLGVLRGTVEDKHYFTSHGINVEESDSVVSLLKKLKRGRIDVCILVDAAGQYTLDKIFPGEQEQFVQVVIPGSERPIALMIDVDDPQGRAVAQRYRRVLDSTLQSRQYHEILLDFYGTRPVPPYRMELLKKFEQVYAIDWEQ